MMQLTSRVVGVHKLQLLNFYPFLQKYIAPHQRDETQILAALVQVLSPTTTHTHTHTHTRAHTLLSGTTGKDDISELCGGTFRQFLYILLSLHCIVSYVKLCAIAIYFLDLRYELALQFSCELIRCSTAISKRDRISNTGLNNVNSWRILLRIV
jgi:hypothetical protein